jgi:ferredoxin
MGDRRQRLGSMRIPVVDIGSCTLCMGCVAVAPDVFYLNDAGFIAVVEMDHYPEAAVDDAIKYCPEDCICWEDA